MRLMVSACLISVSMYSLSGCGGSASQESGLSAASITMSAEDLFGNYDKIVSGAAFKGLVSSLRASASSDAMDKLKARASDSAFVIGGYKFSGVKTLLSGKSKELQGFSQKYKSMDEYWRAIGLDADKKVTISDFKRGIATLHKSLGSNAPGLTSAERLDIASVQIVMASLRQAKSTKLSLVNPAVAAAADPELVKAAGDAVAGVITAGTEGVATVVGALPPAVNNNVCVGNHSYGQNGNNVKMGPVTVGAVFSSNPNYGGAHCSNPGAPAPGGATNGQGNNNVSAGNNSIVQNGNGAVAP